MYLEVNNFRDRKKYLSKDSQSLAVPTGGKNVDPWAYGHEEKNPIYPQAKVLKNDIKRRNHKSKQQGKH